MSYMTSLKLHKIGALHHRLAMELMNLFLMHMYFARIVCHMGRGLSATHELEKAIKLSCWGVSDADRWEVLQLQFVKK